MRIDVAQRYYSSYGNKKYVASSCTSSLVSLWQYERGQGLEIGLGASQSITGLAAIMRPTGQRAPSCKFVFE
ncbi:hypothetical protein [Reichenbachiella agariperforans]|uniref:hypothetical protein n=1 Tax=Reichenbachiella agariperforans TaxID=156994 RepID=UPI001C084C34|nr:hypothetical protein [Reichenbachiella agariperforans]MBU2912910.1 hypothetical protein [Reichenbachiella agariperforans]